MIIKSNVAQLTIPNRLKCNAEQTEVRISIRVIKQFGKFTQNKTRLT